MTMNKHFAYLIQHDDADFFQKVANEQAEARRPIASQSIMKTAMQNLLEGATFEKIASRLDRDIGILKSAGESGMNCGMQKRAAAYMSQLNEQCELSGKQYAQIFDKVAGAAILGDMQAAYDHISDSIDPSLHPWLKNEIQKVGFDLSRQAAMEKKAITLPGVGELLSGEIKAGLSGARAIRLGSAEAAAIAKATARETAAAARVAKGGEKLKAIEETALEAEANRLKGLKPTKGSVGEAFRGSQLAKNMKAQADAPAQLSKLQAEAARLKAFKPDPGHQAAFHASQTAKNDAAIAALSPKPKPATPPKAVAPKPPKAPKVDTAAPKADAVKAEADAARAAKPAEAPAAESPAPKEKPTKAEGDVVDEAEGGLNAKGGDAGDVTLKGSWGKFRDGGWKSLSGDEKQKLINAGAVAIVGGRVVTGHGIVTGGQGII